MKNSFEWLLSEESETLRAGGVIAAEVGSAVVFLRGNLGTGKTTLSRGILRALGHEGKVKSPTYTLVEPYDLAEGKRVFHFDLYRLTDPEELEYMGIRDYFEQQALCLIEWPEKGLGFLPAADIEIDLDLENLGRRLAMKGMTTQGRDMVQRMNESWQSSEVTLCSQG